MKTYKQFFNIFLLCLSIATYGQPQKNDIMLGGNLNLNFSFLKIQNQIKTTKIEFAPKIGFFAGKNFALGIEVPLSYETINDDDNNYSGSSYVLAFTPFIRQYFGKGRAKPFVFGDIGFGIEKNEFFRSSSDFWSGVQTYSDEYNNKLFLYGIGGGFAYFVGKKISIDIEFGYRALFINPDEDNFYTQKDYRKGFDLVAGFTLVF